jgi:uncharacterized protein
MRDTFTEQLKTAMKAGDKTRISTLRLIQAALKDKDIEARGLGKGPISNDEILSLLQKMLKQRQESLSIYEKAGRADLADQERIEAAIIAEFLPAAMSEAETKTAIQAAIDELSAASMKDMGRVIALLRERFSGQMDFAKVSGMVKDALNQA